MLSPTDLIAIRDKALAAGDVEWIASVEFSDGSLAHRRFWWANDETAARHRAWTIWTLAKAGSDGSFVNPTLKVVAMPSRARAVALRVEPAAPFRPSRLPSLSQGANA